MNGKGASLGTFVDEKLKITVEGMGTEIVDSPGGGGQTIASFIQVALMRMKNDPEVVRPSHEDYEIIKFYKKEEKQTRVLEVRKIN